MSARLPTHAVAEQAPSPTLGSDISDRDFARFQELIESIAGIHLAASKKPLLCGRLSKRLRARAIASYGQYFDLITSGRDPSELETCVNLLTTNETYFFREPRHFEILRERVLPSFKGGRRFRAWSAASSSGQEAYTIAMVTADVLGLGAQWEVFGSDISTAVLEKASAGQYPLEQAEGIPRSCLQAYCLKGVGGRSGTFLIDKPLRGHVQFAQINLNANLPATGEFDVIFLRNVLIYFDLEVKRAVVERLVDRLRPDGWFFVGHSESLNGVTDLLRAESPTVYRRAE